MNPSSFGAGSWASISMGRSISSGVDPNAVSELFGVRKKERDRDDVDNGRDCGLHRGAIIVR